MALDDPRVKQRRAPNRAAVVGAAASSLLKAFELFWIVDEQQLCMATSANTWVELQTVPGGGADGEILAKASSSDFDLEWINREYYPSGSSEEDTAARVRGLFSTAFDGDTLDLALRGPIHDDQVGNNPPAIDMLSGPAGRTINIEGQETLFLGGQYVYINGVELTGPWISFSPVMKTNTTTVTTSSGRVSRYKQLGKMVHVMFDILTTSAGVAGGTLTLDLPVAPRAPGNLSACGSFYVYNGTTQYPAFGVLVIGQTNLRLIRTDQPITSYFGADPNVTFAIGSSIGGSITYEAA